MNGCRLVAVVVSLAVLSACSGDRDAQPSPGPSSSAPATSLPAPASTTPSSTTTLMPPPFASRAAADTREAEWRDIPGSAARECVDVEMFQHLARRVGPNERDIALELRSGEFVAGSFFDLKQRSILAPSDTASDPTYQLKLYWIGLAREPQTPVVTARSIADPTRSPVRATTSSAFNANGTFTASGVVLPAHGRWRITATSADQWGCYDVTI